MTYWWVNQNQTWRDEIFGEYLWSPKLDAKGRHTHFYDNMTRLQPGDIVLSHFNGALRYAGVVESPAISDRKPDFGFRGGNWSDDGWTVRMRFIELTSPVKPQDELTLYLQVAPERFGPMNSQGRVNQQYLFELPAILGTQYLGAAGLNEDAVKSAVRYDPTIERLVQDAEEVLTDPELTPTEKHVLATARIGQGMFKEQVRRFEPICRITGLSDSKYLIASHMRPWRDSNNAERLDGHNGLLLSPHVDHLFDRGLITFKNSGQPVISIQVNSTVPELWHLDLNRQGKRFSLEQVPYLEYHRDVIFRDNQLPRTRSQLESDGGVAGL